MSHPFNNASDLLWDWFASWKSPPEKNTHTHTQWPFQSQVNQLLEHRTYEWGLSNFCNVDNTWIKYAHLHICHRVQLLLNSFLNTLPDQSILDILSLSKGLIIPILYLGSSLSIETVLNSWWRWTLDSHFLDLCPTVLSTGSNLRLEEICPS